MTNKTKIKVGPLPEQSEDYGHFEESQILWGRVCAFALVAVVLLGLCVKWLVSGPSESLTIPTAPLIPQVKSVTEYREPARTKVETLDTQSLMSGKGEVEQAVTPLADSNGSEARVLDESVAVLTQAPADKLPEVKPLNQVISPVSTYHEGLVIATLTQELKDGKPVNSLGYKIGMNEEGIIKVILYTHMRELKGTVLYHDWYLEEQRMARVKIPVNIVSQQSFSSKYINQQMLGDWMVKIVDEGGELYAEANFSVQ